MSKINESSLEQTNNSSEKEELIKGGSGYSK